MSGMNDRVGHYECSECQCWIRWSDYGEVGHSPKCSHNPNKKNSSDSEDN